jgi:preprotein translocase subunit YajC
MFSSAAYAQAATPAPAGSGTESLISLLPFALMFVVFYFLLIRPQQRKMKEHKAMLDALRRGDKVVTGGGIIGSVTHVGSDDEITVEIADGVRVRALRSAVTAVLSKTEPVKAESKN